MNKIAKDMRKVYFDTPTVDLLKNLGRKKLQLMRLEGSYAYWAKKERSRLQYLIDQIEAVLASRAAQEPLF